MATEGPWISAALLCERVITEGDGVLSFIRVIDRVTQSATGVDPPAVMPPFQADLQMVVALKAGKAKGRFTIKFVIESPQLDRLEVGAQDINLTPGSAGANLVIGLQLGIEHEGVYWIDVLFGGEHVGQEDELLTRVPLEVVYQRQRVHGAPGHPES